MARRPHISIITLTVNGLKAPIKRECLNGYKNKTHIYAANNRLKVRFPGDSQFLCWILRLGNLMWGLQQCANFLGIIVLQFVSCPTNGMGFDFIVTGPHLLSHCSFSFVPRHGLSCFGGLQHPLSMVVQQLVVILMSSWEKRPLYTLTSLAGQPKLDWHFFSAKDGEVLHS